MGSPKKQRKKYETPLNPWEKDRIDQEKKLIKEYGLKNKKELWKAQSDLRRYLKQAKKLISSTTEQTKKEEKQLLARLLKYNLITKDMKVEDVLNLTPKHILDRRLQSVVYKKGLANTINQARQFIRHGHVMVNDQKNTVPSYYVTRDEEGKITFNPSSNLSKPEVLEKAKQPKKEKSKVVKVVKKKTDKILKKKPKNEKR